MPKTSGLLEAGAQSLLEGFVELAADRGPLLSHVLAAGRLARVTETDGTDRVVPLDGTFMARPGV